MKLAWNKTRFMKSALWPEEYPKISHHSSQIAICGRSNVGKSSLINELCANNSLAKTSKTPGKTQLLNFFEIDEKLVFVDLPGYGFAKVPERVQKDWGKIITNFLENAPQLALILFLLDIRRTPNKEDLEFLHWLNHYQIPFILVLTKADKVTKNELAACQKEILSQLPYEGFEVLVHSSKTHQGTIDLRKMIEAYATT
ncbi:MAG: YihA family ribosome biogenesis GTP-binding protein [Verrucomicrobia bacterium]|nr:YihA family ribosome biogenesis GTP-binding protein [Verrucomicrobiota bacterium]MBS0636769.1 YihA family ribosome biogenesis GTP-binding protein [Verrucomicrobiota bacterium]